MQAGSTKQGPLSLTLHTESGKPALISNPLSMRYLFTVFKIVEGGSQAKGI